MIIEFNEKQHVYRVDGDIAKISVTELLAKHGLAPNYKGVNPKIKEDSAKMGKKVHKDLENLLNMPKFEPKTPQGLKFKGWVEQNVNCAVGEQKMGLNWKGMTIAGTADVMGYLKGGEVFVGDHKNTSKFHREYVTWQVNLLDYMARHIGDGIVNGRIFHWKGATKFFCFQYDPNTGDLTVHKLDKIPDSEIEKLIECEYNDEIYQRPQLVVDAELRDRFLQAEEKLSLVQQQYLEAEKNAKLIREQMLKLFEEQGIKSWESPNKMIKVTYVEPVDRLSVDSEKLKKKYPIAFSDCQKLTKIKSQIRIKLRGEEDE